MEQAGAAGGARVQLPVQGRRDLERVQLAAAGAMATSEEVLEVTEGFLGLQGRSSTTWAGGWS
jgi:hypothetical protein